jgi:sugar phosphate isomerase/epimerase
MKIGAQLYTLRDYCTNLEDFADTLKKVAEIGYTVVQVSGVCQYEPEWLANELKKNGLKCALTHWGANDIKDNTVEVLNKHRVFDCNYVGIGCMPPWATEENTYKFIEDFKEPAKILKENGGKLFYHNHHCEFKRCSDGEMIFDKLINAFEPSEMSFTLDTYWVQYGGGDVCSYIEKMKGRCECIHLKDLAIVNDEQRMAPVGSGSMDFKKIIKAAESSGVEYLLVEQDNCYGENPFECLKKSYDYLTSLGLN